MARGGWNKGKKTEPLSEECKRKISESLTGRKFTDEHRQRISAALKDKPKSEEHCKNLSISRKKFFQTEAGREFNERRRKLLRGRPSPTKGIPRSEADKATMREAIANRTPKERQLWIDRLSLACQGRPAWNKGLSRETDPRIAKYSGDNHYMWMGGISFEPYGYEFNIRLRKAIRKRDNQTCQMCGSGGRCVHHIDYDKQHNDPLNLITLCRSCHGRTNTYRDSWDFFLSVFQLERIVLKRSYVTMNNVVM